MARPRVIVWIPTRDRGWEIEPARDFDSVSIGGGLRTLHEVAVAVAATGRAVEMRGVVHAATLDALAAAAGARPELPERARPLTANDTIIVPEGIDDPAIHARLALSPARVIIALLGPPGLIGWPFVPGWSPPDPLRLDIGAVARPEHFRGAAALGHELWTPSPGIAAAAEAAGVGCRLIGSGSPLPFPAPAKTRDIDLVTLRDSRWWPLAKPVLERLDDLGFDCVALPQSDQRRVLEAFGRARIVVHPLRVEGHSRVSCEARAMGAVPAVPDTNPFGVGLDAAGGALPIGESADMSEAIAALLSDPGRLARLSAAAMRTAREQVEWEPFLRRIDAALEAPAADRARGVRAAAGAALRERSGDAPADRRPPCGDGDQPVGDLERSLAILNESLLHERADLARHKLWLESIERSLSWRLTAPLRAAAGRPSAAAARLLARAAVREQRADALVANSPAPSGFLRGPEGHVDAPADGELVTRRPQRIHGWCVFPGSTVTRVDVVVDALPAMRARLAIERPDVAAVISDPAAPVSGFELIVDLGRIPHARGSVTIETVAHAADGRSLRLAPVTVAVEPAPAADVISIDAPAPWRRRRSGTPGRRLKVVAFSHQLSLTGAPLYLVELLLRLREIGGFEVTVVTFEDGPLREVLNRAGIAVHTTGEPPVAGAHLYEGRLAELGAWLDAQGADVALVNALGAFAGADAATRLGIPTVWAIHDSLDPAQFLTAAYGGSEADPHVLARLEDALRTARRLVFPADATARLFEHHTDPERLTTLPYGIELGDIDVARRFNRRDELRRYLGIAPDARVVLCLGSIEARKAQAMLAQAFAQVAGAHPSALLLLVGKGGPSGYSSGLEEYVARSGLASRVRIEPTTSDPFSFHMIADLLVCASDVESLPRSIAEAMAFETPVLSTRVFGVPELIDDGRTGFLCEPRDGASLARTLDRVLRAEPRDLRAVASAGAEVVRRRHDPQRRAAEFAALLRQAAGAGAGEGSLLREPQAVA